MTPMDMIPVRVPQPAERVSVQPVAGKAGDKGEAQRDGEFHEALTSVAQDKQDKAPAAGRHSENNARSILERARRLDAAKAAVKDEAAAKRLAKGDDAVDGDAKLLADNDEADQATLDAALSSPQLTAAPEKVLAQILAQGTLDARQAQGAASHDKHSGTASANLASDADAAAARPLREVKILSVKVETHFAPVGANSIALELAQKLASAAANGTTAAKSSVAETAAGAAKRDAGEATLPALQDLDLANAVAQARGKAGAGHTGDRRGADTSGSGTSAAASDAKAAAQIAARKAPEATDVSGNGAAAQLAGPAHQLAPRMLALAQELGAQHAQSVSAPGLDQPAAANGPVRVLSINLHPAELGSVTVRMSLVRDALEVQIEAEHPATARMLQTDSDALSDMLRNAGIQVDGVTVRAAAPDTVSASTGSGQSYLGEQTQGGGADAWGAGGNRREQGQAFGERAAARGGHEDSTSQRSAGGGLYV